MKKFCWVYEAPVIILRPRRVVVPRVAAVECGHRGDGIALVRVVRVLRPVAAVRLVVVIGIGQRDCEANDEA